MKTSYRHWLKWDLTGGGALNSMLWRSSKKGMNYCKNLLYWLYSQQNNTGWISRQNTHSSLTWLTNMSRWVIKTLNNLSKVISTIIFLLNDSIILLKHYFDSMDFLLANQSFKPILTLESKKWLFVCALIFLRTSSSISNNKITRY